MQNLKKILKNKKGFTLVELMVVVAILGVLVAIAVPVYSNVTASAEKTTCAANIRTIKSAITMAQADGVALADIDSVSALSEYLEDDTLKCPVTKNAYEITDGVVDETAHAH